MQRIARNLMMAVAVVGWLVAGSGLAQEPEPAIVDGTIRFNDDPQVSLTRCSIINTLGEELFARQCDGRIVLARSIFSVVDNGLSTEENNKDVLTDYVMGSDFRVTDQRTGVQNTLITFAADANDLRTVFWVAGPNYPPVQGVDVTGGVVSFDRVTMTISVPIVPVVDEEGNVIRLEPFYPRDLGFDISTGGGGREGLFLPCGADRTIIDTDRFGEAALGCDAISGGGTPTAGPACGAVGNSLLLTLTFLAGVGLIRRSGTG